jgi:hypothetical protein
MILAALLLAATPAPPAAPPAVQPTGSCFTEGPLAGLCPGPVDSTSGGWAFHRLLPGPAAPPPLPPRLANLVTVLVGMHDHARTIPADLMAPGAMLHNCLIHNPDCPADQPLTFWPNAREERAGAPWLLADGRIRIAWTRGGTITTLTYLTLQGERLAQLFAIDAHAPVRVAN